MTNLYSYLESSTNSWLPSKTKTLNYTNLGKLSSSDDLGFLFFDTETTGLITKGDTTFSLRSENVKNQTYKQSVLKNLLSKYNLPEKSYWSVQNFVNEYTLEQERSNIGQDLDLNVELPQLYTKTNYSTPTEVLQSVASEYYTLVKSHLENPNWETELVEFYGVFYSLTGDTSQEKSEGSTLHQYWNPSKLSDEIVKLVHWNSEKELKAKTLNSSEKYERVVRFFERSLNSVSTLVVAGHNVVNFDLPLLLLVLYKHDFTLYNRFISVLRSTKLYVLDTRNLNSLFKVVTSKIRGFVEPKLKRQVTLQKLLNVRNPSQHTADGDVRALVEVFERLLVLYAVSQSETSTLRDVSVDVKKLVSAGVTKKLLLSYLKYGATSNVFKKVQPSTLQLLQYFVEKIRKEVQSVMENLPAVKNKDPQKLDRVVARLALTYFGTVQTESTVLNEKLKKRDVLPGRVRKFARGVGIEDANKFVRYFVKKKDMFLAQGKPLGYAIALAYKVSKRKFGVQ